MNYYILDALAIPPSEAFYNSLLMLVAVLLAFGLLTLGYVTKARVFYLFSVGVFIFLAIQLSEFVPLLIVFIGLIIYLLYMTFKGD